MKVIFRYNSSKKLETFAGIVATPNVEYDLDVPLKEGTLTKRHKDLQFKSLQFEAINGASITLLINTDGYVVEVYGSTMIKTPLGHFPSFKKASKFLGISQASLKNRCKNPFDDDFKLVHCTEVF